jgi:hypothetical protein
MKEASMFMNVHTALTIVASTVLFAACGDQGSKPAASTADHGHDHADGSHDHAADSKAPAGDDHGHGPVVELGSVEAGGYTVKASRDGAVKAGGEAPIDVWVTGGEPVSAVRFWIGTQDGAGALKAKAELERDNWHTHAEVPDPMPAGSKLWVEIDSAKGTTVLVGFDLKA